MSLHDGLPLDKNVIRDVFAEIGATLSSQGKTAEIAVFGGCALAITFHYRDSTQDMDYMPISGDISSLIEITDRIGTRLGLSQGWFNDAVEVFAADSQHDDFGSHFDLQGEYGQPTGLRVFTATPRYLLAMKCMALRSSLVSSDPLDVWHLIDACGFTDAQQAIDMVAKFYPSKQLPERNRLVLQDLFEAKMNGESYNTMLAW